MAKAKEKDKPAAKGGKAAKGGGKSKFNAAEFLLAKGQWLALGVGGGAFLLFALMGVTAALDAKSPDKISGDMDRQAKAVTDKLRSPTGSAPDLPEWARPDKKVTYPQVDPNKYALANPFFDPIAKPDSKRENPAVLGVEEVQVDLIRAPMRAYDLILEPDGSAKIAVLKTKTVSGQNITNLVAGHRAIQERVRGLTPRKGPAAPPPPPMAQPMPGAGEGQPGGPGYAFDVGAQRTETVIDYVSLAEADQKKMPPAMTVLPLRLIVANCAFPLRKQLEEMQKALRLARPEDALRFGPYPDPTAKGVSHTGPVFTGYKVQRKVTGPNGKVLQDWVEYDYVDQYARLIDARKLEDHPDDGYLTNFLWYHQSLALPLPALVKNLGQYPPLALKTINDEISKLIQAEVKPEAPSDFITKLLGQRGAGIFTPKTAGQTGASAIFGNQGYSAPVVDNVRPGVSQPLPMGEGGNQQKPPPSIDYILVRFLDADVLPGHTYEYRLQVMMRNPNYGQPTQVSQPADASKPLLYGPWVPFGQAVTVPQESFVYGYDPARYQAKAQELAGGSKEMLDRLKVREFPTAPNNPVPPTGPGSMVTWRDAAIEVQTWMPQVRSEASRKREPVGAWVVGEMPVARGEYLGRKQFVRLPLWSSETQDYVLRKLDERVVTRGEQPSGWMVDFTAFTDNALLVDFEGGKVKAAAGSRSTTDESGVEMLVLRSDGKLTVRRTEADMADRDRRAREDAWTKWLKEVEKRPAPGSGTTPKDTTDPFKPKA